MVQNKPNNNRNPENTGENENNVKIYEWIWGKVKKLFTDADKQNQERLNEFEKKLVESFEHRIEILSNEKNALTDRVSFLEHQMGIILPKFTEQSQDPASIYNPASSTPQNYELTTKFTLLRDNDFSHLSRELFKTFSNHSNLESKEKTRRFNEIHSILAEEILFKGMQFLQTENIKDLDNMIIQFTKNVKIALEEYGVNVTDETSELFQDTVKDGITLVRDMSLAKPSGKLLWLDGENEKFDSNKHEPRLFTQESGIIDLMIHPGYIVGNEINLKAWVITKPLDS